MAGDSKLETDYLVVGAGALGMAFVDTLIEHSGPRRWRSCCPVRRSSPSKSSVTRLGLCPVEAIRLLDEAGNDVTHEAA
jgi:hypothetical protein